MFGTNGIRGIPNADMPYDKIVKIGSSIAKVLGSKDVAIAEDSRVTSSMVRCGVSLGLMLTGVSVRYLGMLPTPALQYYVKTHDDVSGGVMITASHNPPEFNGIKCISADGTECSPKEEKAIEDCYDGEIDPVSWDEVGSESIVLGASDDYVESVVSKVDADAIKKAKLFVCLDCANGASVNTSPAILKKLGVKCKVINGEADGMFPGHYSEPVEENLSQLKKEVVNSDAALGIAHDGDADRSMFITSSGKFVGGDISLALLSRFMMEAGGNKIAVTTVASSSVMADVVEKAGGKVVYTAVGAPVVARRMMKEGSAVGGEENGGCIFGDHQYCRDGGMAMARMLENIVKNGSLDEQIASLPKYYTIKQKVICPDSEKKKVAAKLLDNHREDNVNTMDGLRIDYSDGWILIRPSGTEPIYRIYSESKDEKTAKERASAFMNEFDAILRGNSE